MPAGLPALSAALDERAAMTPDRTAFIWDDQRESFGDFREAAREAGAGLLDQGLRPGDRFAIYLRNCPEFIHVWMGGIITGIQPVTINIAFQGAPLRDQLDISDCRLVVTSEELLPHVQAVVAPGSRVEVIVVTDAPRGSVGVAAAPVVALADVVRRPADLPARDVEPGDPATVLYTSGTTGGSKAVQLTHGHLAGVAWSNCREVGITADDITCIPVPLYHATGINGVLHAIWSGCTTVVERRFKPVELRQRLVDLQVTVLTVVGPILRMLWNLPPADVEKRLVLRCLFGNPIDVPFDELHDRWGIEYVATAYGQTEVQPCIVGRLPEIPYGAAGRLHPNLSGRLVDDDGVDVPDSTSGELILRANVPHSMLEHYLKNPAANAEAFVDGWYRTGDLLSRDPDGIYFWIDRKKDVIRRRGENISSVDVERALLEHPDVVEAAVHGVPSELAEEAVKAVVVSAAGTALTAEALHDFVAETLPRFAVPRYIEFVGALPKNPTGRVKKFELRQRPMGDSTWDRRVSHSKLKVVSHG